MRWSLTSKKSPLAPPVEVCGENREGSALLKTPPGPQDPLPRYLLEVQDQEAVGEASDRDAADVAQAEHCLGLGSLGVSQDQVLGGEQQQAWDSLQGGGESA